MSIFIQLSQRELSDLSWAIKQAETWHGSLTGGDRATLDAFEARVRGAKRAMSKVRKVAKMLNDGTPPRE